MIHIRHSMRINTILCFIALLTVCCQQMSSAYGQPLKNELPELVRRTIRKNLNEYKRRDIRFIEYRKEKISIDPIFLNVDHLPLTIIPEPIDGVRFYSDYALRGLGLNQAHNSMAIIKQHKPGKTHLCWDIEYFLSGRYLEITVTDIYISSDRKMFSNFYTINYSKLDRKSTTFEYDCSSETWIESEAAPPITIYSYPDILQNILSENIELFISDALQNNILDSAKYIAISVDGYPLWKWDTTDNGGKLIYHLRQKYDFNINGYSFIDPSKGIDNFFETTKNGMLIVFPQVSLAGDKLTITISLREFYPDRSGMHESIMPLAIGQYVFQYDCAADIWSLKETIFK